MEFEIQKKIDMLNSLNSKVDLLIQSQMYSMPFKGQHELFKWSFNDSKLTIRCVHLGAYIQSMNIIYKDETVTYKPTEKVPKSIFQCQRPTRPTAVVLNLNESTMVQPFGPLMDLLNKWVGEDMAYNTAFIQSLIIQYATAHKLFQENVIKSDACLMRVFDKESISVEMLDELVTSLTKKIDPIEISLDQGDRGGNSD
eukprot:NODE_55_length_26219_cov_0.194908.p13 type:complete len:198 gc:universal NODE_55_length_26219_cov_0.194908:14220-13627(-)